MTTTKQSLLWAAALIAIAVLAIFEVIPEEVAQYSVVALPALAVVSMITRRSCGSCNKARA